MLPLLACRDLSVGMRVQGHASDGLWWDAKVVAKA